MQRNATLAKYLNPWKFKREEAARQQRITAIRERDGDNCQRCRRPMRFDLPDGHDQAPQFHQLASPKHRPQSMSNAWSTSAAMPLAPTTQPK